MLSVNSYIQIHTSSSSCKNATVLQNCKNAKRAPALKPRPHLNANVKQMQKRTQIAECPPVGEQHSPSFTYAVSVWRTGVHYPSGVCTSKKNTFAIILMWTNINLGRQRITSGTLARSLVWWMLNKQLFGICSHSPRSRMPCLRSHTDVDAPLQNEEWFQMKVKLINSVLHNCRPCQYIFTNIWEVYTLHLSKILPQFITSIHWPLFWPLSLNRKMFTLQTFLQQTKNFIITQPKIRAVHWICENIKF